MEKKDNILEQAWRFMQSQQKHRRWLRAMTAMAAVVVFVTTYLLILPAVTMGQGTIRTQVGRTVAVPGEAVTVGMEMEAAGGQEETVFVLRAEGENAGLDESQIVFDEKEKASVTDVNGEKVTLHREYEEDGSALYWFSLKEGQTRSLSLPWINGVDSYHSVVTEEKISSGDEEKKTAPEEKTTSGKATSEKNSGTEESGEKAPADTPTQNTAPQKEHNTAATKDTQPVKPAESTTAPEKAEDTDKAKDIESATTEAPEKSTTAAPSEQNDTKKNTADAPKEDAGTSKDNTENVPAARSVDAAKDKEKTKDHNSAAAALLAELRQAATLEVSAGTVTDETAANGVIYHKETVFDAAGDPAAEGSVILTLGSGKTLEDAKKHITETIKLSWQADETSTNEEVSSNPDNPTGSSWATVAKENADNTGTNTTKPRARMKAAKAAGEEGAARDAGQGHDFSGNITGVTVSTLQNGQWVSGTEFTDGDSVRVNINYTIPTGIVGGSNKTIYYNMPDGITLAQQESGTVYDNGVPVGTYTITTDDHITIEFNDAFADERAFTGQIQFQGRVWAKEGQDETEINFGTGGSITVKPNPDPTDVRVEKSGSYNESDKKLHYELTVSTTKGTGGAITVNDSFGVTNTHATYDKDSFQIVKVDAEGNETTVTGYTPTITNDGWEGAPEKFTITGLPALGEGERYHITYTATPGKTNDALGASNVNNSVNVTTEGGNNSNGWNEVIISHSMLSKGGYYDAAAGVIKWTITLNPDKKDIGGWKLTDNVTAQNGVTVTMPQKVNISPAVNGQSEITLPYTFPEGSSDSYTITYETKVEGLQPGEQAQVTNKAEFDGGDEHYEQGSTVYPSAPDYSSNKSSGGVDSAQSNDSSGIYKWNATINVLDSVNQDDLDKIIYKDTIFDLVGENGQTIEGSHYITGAQLDAMSVKVGNVTLIQDHDYTIHNANGTEEITDFSSDAHYKGFQIHFTESSIDKIKGQTINLQYSTTVDYTRLTDGIQYTIRNKGGIPGHENDVTQTYKPVGKLEKQASVTGNHTEYKTNGVSIDYEASGGIIHYRLLVHNIKDSLGDIEIKDILPKGAELVDDTVSMKFYQNDYSEPDTNWGNPEYKPNENITYSQLENNDGTTTVTFTIKDGYNSNPNNSFDILVIYYDVSIAKDEIWDDPSTGQHIYTNHASWGDNSTSTDVTVDREVPTLAKTGAQLPQLDDNGEPMKDTQGNPVLSNTVRYYVTINQAAQDLDPVQDNLKLTDKLKLPSNIAGADLNVGSVHLYHFDMNAENHCGQEINPARYSYTYDSASHTMTFTVPDSTAMVLVYEYTIDRGSAAGELHLSNSVELTGVDGSKTDNQVQFQETSSSATVSKRTLTIYKVDGENYGTTLPEAKFKLEKFDTLSNWTVVNVTLVSDEKGQIVLDQTDDDSDDIYQSNVLLCGLRQIRL